MTECSWTSLSIKASFLKWNVDCLQAKLHSTHLVSLSLRLSWVVLDLARPAIFSTSSCLKVNQLVGPEALLDLSSKQAILCFLITAELWDCSWKTVSCPLSCICKKKDYSLFIHFHKFWIMFYKKVWWQTVFGLYTQKSRTQWITPMF